MPRGLWAGRDHRSQMRKANQPQSAWSREPGSQELARDDITTQDERARAMADGLEFPSLAFGRWQATVP
jgi:hypothetical protein